MTSTTLRLTNFLLDSSIYFILLVLFMLTFKKLIPVENVKWFAGFLYFLYYFLFEYFKCQTIGKMITNSKVISLTENNKYFFIQIFVRSLVRIIPFDILSYMFTSRGLHDLFSKTAIINLNINNQNK